MRDASDEHGFYSIRDHEVKLLPSEIIILTASQQIKEGAVTGDSYIDKADLVVLSGSLAVQKKTYAKLTKKENVIVVSPVYSDWLFIFFAHSMFSMVKDYGDHKPSYYSVMEWLKKIIQISNVEKLRVNLLDAIEN